MNEDLAFVDKHRNKGALVDANLLLVYVVGLADKNNLVRNPHTKQYASDFPAIKHLLEDVFTKIYTTPNVLTEVSNLGKGVGAKFWQVLRTVVDVLDERYCVSKESAAHEKFNALGLTDAGLCNVASQHLVVTADLTLYTILRGRGIDAVNFNHLRPWFWRGQLKFR